MQERQGGGQPLSLFVVIVSISGRSGFATIELLNVIDEVLERPLAQLTQGILVHAREV
jgi:hypothetical protein